VRSLSNSANAAPGAKLLNELFFLTGCDCWHGTDGASTEKDC